MKIVVTDSTGVSIPILLDDSKTFPEVNQRIENEHDRRMKFTSSHNVKHLDSDQDVLAHFPEDEDGEAETEVSANQIKLENFKEASSFYSENVLKVVIPTRDHSVKQASELLEEFHAVMDRIKSEEMEVDEGCDEENHEEIETFDLKPIMLSRTYEVPRSEQGLQFSEVILESNNHTSIALLCRLCATQCEDMIFIFSPNEEYKNIVEMIKNCLPIMVSDKDTLPKQVCRWCVEKLELCHKFRQAVVEAEKQLMMLDEKISDESENIADYPHNLPFHSGKKVMTREAEESESDKETSDEEEEEYFPAKLRSSESCNGLKRSSKKNPTTSQVDSAQKEMTNPVNQSGSDGETSDDDLYMPPITRSGKLPIITKKLNEKNCHAASGEEAINDHTYASQNDEYNMTKCRICGLCFENARSCYLHSSIHASKQFHPCSICCKSFKSEETYCRHSIFHMGAEELVKSTEAHTCKLCKKIFSTIDRLKFHKTYHDPKLKPCYCEKCDKVMVSESAMYGHMINVHGRSVKFDCQSCGKVFRDELHLRIHQGKFVPDISSRKERQFECTMCRSKFYSVHQVELHKKHHCRSRYNFVCSYCEKSFSRKWTLSNHIRLHTGERPYNCQFCEKTYQTKRSRDQHEVTHTNKGKYKCILCEKSFCTSTRLRIHENVHAKYADDRILTPYNAVKLDTDNNIKIEKRFQCNICAKYFLGPSTLQIHKRTQHEALD